MYTILSNSNVDNVKKKNEKGGVSYVMAQKHIQVFLAKIKIKFISLQILHINFLEFGWLSVGTMGGGVSYSLILLKAQLSTELCIN